MNAYKIQYIVGYSYEVEVEAESESMARIAFERMYNANCGEIPEAEKIEATHEITGIELQPNTVDVTVSVRMVHTHWADVELTVSREDFDRADAFGDYSSLIENNTDVLHEELMEDVGDCEIIGESIAKA